MPNFSFKGLWIGLAMLGCGVGLYFCAPSSQAAPIPGDGSGRIPRTKQGLPGAGQMPFRCRTDPRARLGDGPADIRHGRQTG